MTPSDMKLSKVLFSFSKLLVFNRYCLPSAAAIENSTAVKEFKERFYANYLSDRLTEGIADIWAVWYVELASIGTAFLLGIIFMFLLRCCAGPLIFVCLVGILIFLGGGGAWLYFIGREKYKDDADTTNYDYMTYASYVVWGLAGLYFLILLCLCNRIRLGVAIVKATARFIQNTWSLFFIPIVFLLIILAYIAFWFFTAAYIFSVGTIGPRDSPFSFVTTVKWSDQTRYIFIYHLFGLLWVNAFIIGCAQFVIAAACAIWYFSHTSDTGGKGSVFTGVKWIFRYHLGSIAFGSFIIALVQMIRIIFEYYRRKIQMANKNNPVVKFLLCCTSYLLACLERCIKFITKNAYI